jgi:predicted Rossmann fold flavoprotein
MLGTIFEDFMTIAIIGGGAAGLMAAASILEAQTHAKVILIEKNNGLGKKVIISGGGRCNVTTGVRDVRMLLTKYPRGGKFLTSAMYGFSPEAVFDWFEAHGVPLKIEEDLRVFPKSDDGDDVVGAFEKLFRGSAVEVILGANATAVTKTEKGFEIVLKGREETIVADRVILTTGGQAYRHTGSTGDGYAFALSLGHSLTPLAPSLNAFYSHEKFPKEISGLSFENALIRAPKLKKEFSGPFLFTHRGISGPAVFALSSLIAFETYGPDKPLEINVDLFPDETSDGLLKRLMETIAEHPKKSIANVVDILLPKSLVPVVLRETGVAPDQRANETSKKELIAVVQWLKQVPLTIIGRDAGDEFVTAGGIDTKEVDPTTMQSKITPGLFFAGEILDVDGFTGGYNLQASWATGRLAGLSAAV